jgi:PHD/YefM family antitoxin component YafN of YafNO toxin-antitoxin module
MVQISTNQRAENVPLSADDFENLAREIEEKSDLNAARKVALDICSAVGGLKTYPH